MEAILGKRVEVVKGSYRGKQGIVKTVFTSTGRILVQLDDVRQPVTLAQTAVEVVEE